MFTNLPPKKASAQSGLSLVEIMVGMLIAMIGVVVIFQMLAQSEERKRSSSAGSDVQISGILGMAALERDVREGGYGFAAAGYDNNGADTPLMGGCMVRAYDKDRPGLKTFQFILTPIQIIQGALPTDSDTIIVLRGNSGTVPASHSFTKSSDTYKETRSHAGLSPRDYLLITSNPSFPPLKCMTAEITGKTDASSPNGLTVEHEDIEYTYITYNTDGTVTSDSRIARHNNPTPLDSFVDGLMFNLGNGPTRNHWTVVAGKLQSVNELLHVDANGDGANDALIAADGIINLQAEYGMDLNNNGRIDPGEWTTNDPSTLLPTPLPPTQWANILAVRVGMLFRSPQFEKNVVTSENRAIYPGSVPLPGWAGGAFTITNLDGTDSSTVPTEDVNNWRHYRYRVYETVIPLRNMLWGTQIRP